MELNIKPEMKGFGKKAAILFVVLFGCVSLFADMTYEAARSIMGPYLKLLGARRHHSGLLRDLEN